MIFDLWDLKWSVGLRALTSREIILKNKFLMSIINDFHRSRTRNQLLQRRHTHTHTHTRAHTHTHSHTHTHIYIYIYIRGLSRLIWKVHTMMLYQLLTTFLLMGSKYFNNDGKKWLDHKRDNLKNKLHSTHRWKYRGLHTKFLTGPHIYIYIYIPRISQKLPRHNTYIHSCQNLQCPTTKPNRTQNRQHT